MAGDPNTMMIPRGDGGVQADAAIYVDASSGAISDASASLEDAAVETPRETGDLRLFIVGVPDRVGQFTWGLYSEENAGDFPDTDPPIGARIPITAEDFTIDIPDLAPGRYAVAVYHDRNSNGVLDKGGFGQPLEKWGSTNNVTHTFHGPDFDESAVEVEAGYRTETTIQIHN